MKCFCHYFSLRVFFNFFTSSLLTYFAKEAPVRGVFVFFFICMLMSKVWPVRVFIRSQLFLRGREVKVTVFPTAHIVWLWFWMGRRQVKSNWGWWEFNSSLAHLDRPVDDPPKTKVKAGRGVQENTRQYREAKEANVLCLVFSTNI